MSSVPYSWKADYAAKVTPIEAAIGRIQSGDRIGSGHAAGEPVPLVEELCRQKDQLFDVEISHMNAFGPTDYCKPGFEGHIHHTSLFAGANSRKGIWEGRADYIPVFFSEIPRLYREKHLPIDVALIAVSPPDEDGYCSYGVSVDYAQAMAEVAPLVIAEVNQQMPYTYGAKIHVSDLDVIVETNRPLFELPAHSDGTVDPNSVEGKIAGYISALIPDGAVLQLGIGGIPNAVLSYLKDKKDLSVHTEMFSDGVMDLVDRGVINGKNNILAPGKLTATFIVGSEKLYRFLDHNPVVNMQPVDYTNNPIVASRLSPLISINSAIQVDYFGEVCSDTIGFNQFSGVGGQVDFVRATSMSEGGVSVIALPSTAKNGTVSRIVPTLDPGACVMTSRNDVHYVVTEYGCVNLRGKSITERTEALISIAHPDFRDRLWDQACRLGFMTQSRFCLYREWEGFNQAPPAPIATTASEVSTPPAEAPQRERTPVGQA